MIIYAPNKSAVPREDDKSRKVPKRPTRNPGVGSSFGRKWGRRLAVLALAVLLVGGGYAVWHKLFPASNQQKVSVSARQTVTSKGYLQLSDRAAGKNTEVSMVAPTSWRLTSDDGSQTKVLHAQDALVSHFAFKPDAPGGSADGDIVLETLSGWLGSAEKAGDYGGLATPTQRLAYVNFLTSLRQAHSVSPADGKNIIAINGQVGGRYHLNYVESADGRLSGVIFETIISLDGGYQPVVLTYLAGTVDDQPVYLRGVVTYQDQTFADLYENGTKPSPDQVQKAVQAFVGGQVDDGMVKLAGHLHSMIKTLTISPGKSPGGGSKVIH